jgi:1,4-dihydroxy-2-naphthoate octaprenyltransferase
VFQLSTIQLLRFHFSFFLVPVYLFALSQLPSVNWSAAGVVFFILHVLVYPASNGYNSYMDRDETPIGGLAHPLKPTKQLFYASVVMDALAVALSMYISVLFAVGILLYIIASRAYSYRGIRLKRYPIAGFATVFLFQGAVVFWLTYHGVHPGNTTHVPLLPCVIASCLIGALYPLTQIYQHKEDREDGVITISMLLGKRGSFVFSMFLFLTAAAMVFFWFKKIDSLNLFYLFLLVTLPVVLFFLYWMRKVFYNESAADFKHSLLMNVIATGCTAVYFTTLIILKH